MDTLFRRGESISPLFLLLHPTSYQSDPCQNRSFFVCSSNVLPIYRYGEYTKNIRRNYGPGKARTGGEFGSGNGRRGKSGKENRGISCKDFGLMSGLLVVLIP